MDNIARPLKAKSITIKKNCSIHGLTLHSKQKNGIKDGVQQYAYRCLYCDRIKSNTKYYNNRSS